MSRGEAGRLLPPAWSQLVSKCQEAVKSNDTFSLPAARAGLPALHRMLDDVERDLAARPLSLAHPHDLAIGRLALSGLAAAMGNKADGVDAAAVVWAYSGCVNEKFGRIAAGLAEIDEGRAG